MIRLVPWLNMKARWGILATSAVMLALLLSSTASTARADDDEDIAGELTAIWWQWLYSVPLAENPANDDTGEFAFEKQPFDNVMFLAGTFSALNVGSDVHGTATRNITVDEGTAFFFPLMNTEWDNVVFDTPVKGTASVVTGKNALTIKQMKADAAAGMDSATGLYCTLTKCGKTTDVPYTRVKSPVFSYHLPKGNIYEAYGQTITGKVAPAVSDGYWSYIEPLEKGTYTLKFGGESPLTGGNFYLDITYNITVE